MLRCDQCNKPINPDRIIAMNYTVNSPDIRCQNHSIIEHSIGLMIYDHKTAGTMAVAKGKENIRRLQRQYRRSR